MRKTSTFLAVLFTLLILLIFLTSVYAIPPENKIKKEKSIEIKENKIIEHTGKGKIIFKDNFDLGVEDVSTNPNVFIGENKITIIVQESQEIDKPKTNIAPPNKPLIDMSSIDLTDANIELILSQLNEPITPFIENITFIEKTVYSDSYPIIAINSEELPELNKPATLVFENLDFNETPKILYSSKFTIDINDFNEFCPNNICSNINYEKETGTLTLDVSKFSAYTSVSNECIEAPVYRIQELRDMIEDRMYIVRESNGMPAWPYFKEELPSEGTISNAGHIFDLRYNVMELTKYYYNLYIPITDIPTVYYSNQNQLFRQAFGKDTWTNQAPICITETDLTEVKSAITKLKWVLIGAKPYYTSLTTKISAQTDTEWTQTGIGRVPRGVNAIYDPSSETWSYTYKNIFDGVCHVTNIAFHVPDWNSINHKIIEKCSLKSNILDLPFEIKNAKALIRVDYTPGFGYSDFIQLIGPVIQIGTNAFTYTTKVRFDTNPYTFSLDKDNNFELADINLDELNEFEITPTNQDVTPDIIDPAKSYVKGYKGYLYGILITPYADIDVDLTPNTEYVNDDGTRFINKDEEDLLVNTPDGDSPLKCIGRVDKNLEEFDFKFEISGGTGPAAKQYKDGTISGGVHASKGKINKIIVGPIIGECDEENICELKIDPIDPANPITPYYKKAGDAIKCEMEISTKDGEVIASDSDTETILPCIELKHEKGNDKLDLVFVGDKYKTKEDYENFKWYVDKFSADILSRVPFSTHTKKINTYRVDIIDDLGCRKNEIKKMINGQMKKREILECNEIKADSVADACTEVFKKTEMDKTITIANGLDGGYAIHEGDFAAIGSDNNMRVAGHEVAHLFGVYDEYVDLIVYGEYGPVLASKDVNCYGTNAKHVDPNNACTPWLEWTNVDDINTKCYKGCGYAENYYRPSDSIMTSTNIEGYNLVSQNIIDEGLKGYA